MTDFVKINQIYLNLFNFSLYRSIYIENTDKFKFLLNVFLVRIFKN